MHRTGHIRLLFLAVGFCAMAACAAPRLAAETVRVATFNLQNYLIMDRVADGQWRPAYPKPESEKAALRKVLHEVSPDVLLVQEIGDTRFLEELRLDLEGEGLRYGHALIIEAADTVRRVGILSRIEPLEVRRHSDLDFKYFEERPLVKRGLLEVRFPLLDGRSFTVFALHLKSRWTDDPRDPQSAQRRSREAQACRDRIIERMGDPEEALYLVGGDFNDHPASSAIRRFLRKGDRRLGTLLPIADSRGHVWTHFYAKQATYTQVDGFVVSPALLPLVREGRGHIADLAEGAAGSDHRLVYVDLGLSHL